MRVPNPPANSNAFMIGHPSKIVRFHEKKVAASGYVHGMAACMTSSLG
jgi:hypothetical protein